jgi:hypothetical protein
VVRGWGREVGGEGREVVRWWEAEEGVFWVVTFWSGSLEKAYM